MEVQNFCKHLAQCRNWSGLGLLKAVEFYSASGNVFNTSLNFLHLSLQETLAAHHITLLAKKQQTRLLKDTFLNTRYFNTWKMYVGLTNGHSSAFKHFLSGNRFQLLTSISLLINENARVSRKLTANKVICLHLFQCFSEAKNDEMCDNVGQLLKDGEIDLSGQALSAVNIHTLGLFLDRCSTKHWKLLNLSNCYLGTQEIEYIRIFCSNVHIDQLDVSYNNLTKSSIDILIKMLLIWKVRKAFMYSEDIKSMSNIINHCIRHFPTDTLVHFQTEITPTDLSILVISKYSYSDISTLSAKNIYSSVHLFLCQLGTKINEVARITSLLSKSSQRIYLYDCNTSFEHAFKSVMRCKSSSFHFVREGSTSSETIRCAVEKFAEFAITLGEDVLPLHVLTEKCFQDIEDFIHGNAHGTYVFKFCSQEIIVNLSFFSSLENVHRFVLKKFLKFSRMYFTTVFEKSKPLQYLKLCNCRLQNYFIKSLCYALQKLLHLQNIILSGNNISEEAAKSLASSINDMTKLQHLELERCNLHEEGLASICNVIVNKKLLTLNLSYNIITDQLANKLAQMITENSCIEVIQLSKCSLQYNGMRAILLALGKIESLKLLDISYNKISDPSLNVSAVISTNLHLEQLNLSNCQFKPEHMIKLFKKKKQIMKLLDLSGNHIPEGATFYMTRLLSNAICLQYFSLSKCNLQATVVSDILRNIKHSIKHLHLSYNTIPTTAAEILADVIHNSLDLEHVDLSNCKVEKEKLYLIFKALTEAHNLRFIDLTSIPLNNTLANDLAEIISNNNHSLDYLSLSNCSLTIEGFLNVTDGLKMATVLKHLNVSSNHITSRVMDKLATASELFCKNSQLEHLDISECRWDRDSLSEILVASNKLHNLKCINCSGCEIDFNDFYLHESIINNDNLEQIALANCGLSVTRFVIILNALKMLRTLCFLDVSSNQITSEAITVLGEVVSCNQIEHLNLSHCSLGANCTVVLTAITNSGTLQYLDLSYNDISDDEASCVASSITNNECLHHINLTNNKFSIYGIKLILHAMLSMNFIRYIYLNSYSITDELAVDVEAVALNNKGLVSIYFNEYNINDMSVHLSASISALTVKRLSIMNCTANDFEVGYIESLITNINEICHLNLSFSVIQDCTKHGIVKAIRKQPTLQGLSLNYFTVNKALENEMESLLAQITELQYLELVGCKLTESFLIGIARALSKNNKLRHLNLSYNTLTRKAAAEICYLLSNLSTLQSIEMAECALNRVVCSNISRTLIKLDLSSNPISDKRVGDVVNLIGNNCNLQHLNLSNCAFTSSGILAITEELTGITGLVYLNLKSNHVSDQLNSIVPNVAALIANNKSIKFLHLSDCAIGDIDLEMLFEAIKGCVTPRCSYTLYWDISNSKVPDGFIHNIRIVFVNNLSYTSSELIVSQSQLIQVCDILLYYKAQNISIKCCITEDYVNKLFQIFYNNPFVFCLDIHDSLLSDDFKFLKQSRYWRQIKLYGVVFTKYSINHIASVISVKRNIEHSYYTIRKVSECGINKFYKIFKDTKSLQCFVINNYGSGKFEDDVSLKYLNFAYSMLPKRDVLILCEFISQLTTLVYINLSHNNISTKAAELMVCSIKKTSFLRHLELASCSLLEKKCSVDL